jgi:prophage regulatory protein
MAAQNEEAMKERAETRILRRKQVEARTGLARSTIYGRIKAGTFPAPISLGEKAVGWIEGEIDAWLNAQIAKSRNAGGVAA